MQPPLPSPDGLELASSQPGLRLELRVEHRSPDDVTLSLMVAIWLHVQLPSQRCGEGQVQPCTHTPCCLLAPLRLASVHRGASQLYYQRVCTGEHCSWQSNVSVGSGNPWLASKSPAHTATTMVVHEAQYGG